MYFNKINRNAKQDILELELYTPFEQRFHISGHDVNRSM